MNVEQMILMLRVMNVCVSVVGLGLLITSLFIPANVSPFFPAIIAFSWIVTLFFNPVAKDLWEKLKSNTRF